MNTQKPTNILTQKEHSSVKIVKKNASDVEKVFMRQVIN